MSGTVRLPIITWTGRRITTNLRRLKQIFWSLFSAYLKDACGIQIAVSTYYILSSGFTLMILYSFIEVSTILTICYICFPLILFIIFIPLCCLKFYTAIFIFTRKIYQLHPRLLECQASHSHRSELSYYDGSSKPSCMPFARFDLIIESARNVVQRICFRVCFT